MTIKKSKALNFFIHLFVLTLIIAPTMLYADDNVKVAVQQLENPLKAPNLYAFLFDVLTAFLNVLTVIAAFFIIYSGFMMVTARGNETKLTEAKRSFTFAVIGTAVLLGATVLAKIIEATVNQLR